MAQAERRGGGGLFKEMSYDDLLALDEQVDAVKASTSDYIQVKLLIHIAMTLAGIDERLKPLERMALGVASTSITIERDLRL